jgi:dATP pyrophosphohydrolase
VALNQDRAPFQVLVLPFLLVAGVGPGSGPDFVYALFRRSDAGYWQGVAGGGEGAESPIDAARRELAEETGLGDDVELLPLDSRTTIPVTGISGSLLFGPDLLVVPEHAFGARCVCRELLLSGEHSECGWFAYDAAQRALHWDSNKHALWELDHRLRRESG